MASFVACSYMDIIFFWKDVSCNWLTDWLIIWIIDRLIFVRSGNQSSKSANQSIYSSVNHWIEFWVIKSNDLLCCDFQVIVWVNLKQAAVSKLQNFLFSQSVNCQWIFHFTDQRVHLSSFFPVCIVTVCCNNRPLKTMCKRWRLCSSLPQKVKVGLLLITSLK